MLQYQLPENPLRFSLILNRPDFFLNSIQEVFKYLCSVRALQSMSQNNPKERGGDLPSLTPENQFEPQIMIFRALQNEIYAPTF